jgi:predicted RNase H-like nuclease (RuvC/YqgF family)
LIPITIAAVQETNQKLERELKRRDAENAELKQRLEKLERLVERRTAGR